MSRGRIQAKAQVRFAMAAAKKPSAPIDAELFARLVAPHDLKQPYNGLPRGELFIYWFYRDRKEDRLSKCEIFHLNMLQYFSVMDRVEAIHIRCASSSPNLTTAMQQAISTFSSGKARVDFKQVLPKKSWEHDTIKEAVEYAVETGKFVYYTHFKGVTHIEDKNVVGSYRNGSRTIPGRRIAEIDVLYWCYAMYRYLFVEAPRDACAIGPLLHPHNSTLHYSDPSCTLAPSWAYKSAKHYTGSFQGFDGAFLKRRFEEFGATRAERDRALWVSDPYTVEQFLSLCFRPEEVATLASVKAPYQLYSTKGLSGYIAGFQSLYRPAVKMVCIANGTYKWIGGTDTFNWALAKALLDLGYEVSYYAPDMDGRGVTEKYLQEIGVYPYQENKPLLACFANQQSGKHFLGKCPVVQTCHSAYTSLELPIKGARSLVAVTEEIQRHLAARGFSATLLRNGIDLERFSPRAPLREVPAVLSICQGDDALLRAACHELGWSFKSVPKEVSSRVWHIEDLINGADIVVGIGRSLYDAMACGRACLSWDNRTLNPGCGCGYVTEQNWYQFAVTNFTGRGFPKIDSVAQLVAELKKYNPADGAVMRRMAEKELDVRKNVQTYLRLAELV